MYLEKLSVTSFLNNWNIYLYINDKVVTINWNNSDKWDESGLPRLLAWLKWKKFKTAASENSKLFVNICLSDISKLSWFFYKPI